MEILYEQDFYDDFFVALVKKEKYRLLGIQHMSKRLYELDLETNRETLYMDLPIVGSNMFKLFQTAVLANDKYYFLPFNSNFLLSMTQDCIINKINIGESHGKNKYGKYMNATIINDELMIIPYGANKIVWVDLGKDCVNKLVDISDVRMEDDLFYSSALLDNIIYLPSMTSNRVIRYNLVTEEVSFFKVGKNSDSFSFAVAYESSVCFLLKNRQGLIFFNPNTYEDQECTNFPSNFNYYGESCFDAKSIYRVGRFLYCFPGTANMAVKIDLKLRSIEQMFEFDRYCQNEDIDKNRFIFDGSLFHDNKIILYCQNNIFLVYDLNTLKIEEHKMKLYPEPSSVGINYFINRILKDSYYIE